MNNVENKPDNVADPKVSEEASSASSESKEETLNEKTEVMQERMSEASKGIETVSDLVPKDDQGSTADVSTQGDSSKDGTTNAVDLKELEASTGRKFENVEDFYKHYKNLYGRYGDQEIAKAMKAIETLQNLETKTGKPINEIGDLLASLNQTPTEPVKEPAVKTEPEVKPAKVEPEVKPTDEFVDRLAKLEFDSQKIAFEARYPEASFVQGEVAAIAAKKGTSWIAAFEGSPLKELVELKVKEETSKSPVVTPSSRINVDTKKLEDLGMKVMSGRASEKDQMTFAREYFKSRGKELQ